METKPDLDVCRGPQFDTAATRSVMLAYLDSLATIDDDRLQKRLLKELIRSYVILEKRVDMLLKNTLPETVAEEIKYENRFVPRDYVCTILFSDFVGFTRQGQPPVQQSLDLGRAKHLAGRLAQHCGAFPARDLLGAVTEERDPALGVQGDNPLDDRLQQALTPIFFALQALQSGTQILRGPVQGLG